MKKKINIKNINKIRGIAMVEALMAISIVVISIMAPLTLFSQSAKYAKYALNKITATSLAEEQIELVINFKKSLDIFCFNNPSECDNETEGFDIFVDRVTDVSGVHCDILSSGPCFFDDESFTYPGDSSVPSVNNSRISCKIYEEEENITKCESSSTSKPTVFERKMYIDKMDDITDDNNDITTSAIRLTSLVCINKANCVLGDVNSVVSIYYIYK